MRESAYNHFKNLYKSFNEPVVCVDDKLKVVYATKQMYTSFCVNEKAFNHINCILPTRFLNRIHDIVNEPECISFDFISLTEKAPRHCTVTPVLFEKIYYFIFSFSSTAENALDRLQKRDIEMAMEYATAELAKKTTAIVATAKRLENKKYTDSIIEDIIGIRKVFFDINTLATETVLPASMRVIELNEYIKRITKIISKQLGEKRIEFRLNLCNNVLISPITYDALDVLVCNAVANSIRSSLKKTVISIGTASDAGQNVIVISDTDSGFRRMQLYIDRDKDDVRYSLSSTDDISLAVIEKITRDFGGSIRISENINGGITTGILLPKSTPRADLMCAPENHDIDSDESLIRIALAGL